MCMSHNLIKLDIKGVYTIYVKSYNPFMDDIQIN